MHLSLEFNGKWLHALLQAWGQRAAFAQVFLESRGQVVALRQTGRQAAAVCAEPVDYNGAFLLSEDNSRLGQILATPLVRFVFDLVFILTVMTPPAHSRMRAALPIRVALPLRGA